MNYLTSERVLIAALIVMLALMGFALHETNGQLDMLDAKLNTMALDSREPIHFESEAIERESGRHLDDVYDQLAEIRKLIADVNVERRAEPANMDSTNPDTLAGGRSQAMQVLDDLMAQGYMYEQDWAQIEDQVLGMEREESAIFWESMFTAIENGQLQVPVPEMLD